MATITGTSGGDTLNGTSGNDTLNGLGGNDALVGSGGTDFYDGGTGSDTLDLRATAAGITVSFATGTISGGFNGTFVNIERVLGSNGADSLIGAAGGQNLSARGGNDTLAGGAGVDTLWGGGGADSFVFREVGTANADRVSDFASGSDKIVLDAAVMTALGATGNFAAGDARFVANATGTAQDTNDRVVFNTTTRQVFYDADGNGSGAAVLIATLQSGATLVATDIVVEGSTPPSGDQSINGTSGNDSLVGGAGNDTINGFDGNDTVDGGAGVDSMVGGAGADVYFVDNVADAIVEEQLGGMDLVNAMVSYTLPAWVNNLSLGGTAALDATGNDINNVLIGNSAANVLSGLGGADTLSGGGGSDVFLFAVAPGADNADAITDFVSGTDKLVLDALVMSALGASGNFAAGDARFAANSTGTAQDASDRVVFNTSTKQVFYDADGNGSGAALLIATLQSGAALVATDIAVQNGTPGGQAINGTAGNDSLVGTSGNDTIDGLAGDDSIDGGAGDDSLVGGPGFDSFFMTAADYGRDHIDGGDLIDTVHAGSRSAIVLDLAAGTLSGGGIGGSGSATLVGIETVYGTGFDDRMMAGDARATLLGFSGNDILIGGRAGDTLFGDGGGGRQSGDDELRGGEGNDGLILGEGADSAYGGPGDDSFYPGSYGKGADFYDGGDGRDAINFTNGSNLVVDLAAGTMRGGGIGGDGFATLVNIEDFSAGTGTSHDRITGSAVANLLTGGGGSDTIAGGAGNDSMRGEEGEDRFLFREAPGAANADFVWDFQSGVDKVLLDPAVYAALGAPGIFQAGDARFASGAGFTSGRDATDRIVYDTSTGSLHYDADGSGAGAAELIATLPNGRVTATDIVVGTDWASARGTYNIRTLFGNGPSDNRVDIVFMGDGYTAEQITTEYLPDVEQLIAYMFDDSLLTQPLGRYESFFNIYAIDVISNQSGADHPGVFRDTALGASYNGRSLTIDSSAAQRVLNDVAIEAEMRLVPVNDPTYGGTGGSFAVYSAPHGSANEIALHEAGHQFADLADQYWDFGTTYTGPEPGEPDVTIDPTGAKWGRWLGYNQPGIGTIGAYEGGRYHEHGIYRPSTVSKMQALGYAFDAVGREAFILEFYELVDPLDAWLDNGQTLRENDEFWVDTIDPALIRVDWTINGTTYANAGERISLSSLGFGAGDYTVTARAYDPTDWVRVADRSSLEETVQWRTVNGTSSGQVINGTPGNDSLAGGAGSDTINGFEGNDTIDGRAGVDSMVGGLGDDQYFVDSSGDVVVESVDGGFDTVNASVTYTLPAWVNHLALTGSASISGTGNEVANAITGNSGNNVLTGGDGNDTLDGGANGDQLTGGTGSDVFVFTQAPGESSDSVTDFATGVDKIRLDALAMPALGVSGTFSAGDARFAANSAGTAQDSSDRVIYNTSNGELWYDADGSGANARLLIASLQGAPSLAPTDVDVVNGTAQPGQVINGTAGADTLTGTSGDDTINGVDGNDLFLAGSTGGADVINGGAGRDSIEFKERATSAIVVDFVAGTITGGSSGTISFTSIERVLTGNFDDRLTGNAASQTLTGQGGSDTIAGAGGIDTLWGANGADTFIFREMAAANADRISDFATGSDKLHLDDAAFTAIGAIGSFAAADARFKANSSGTATDTNDRVVFNTSTGQLYYDADGSASGAAQLIATVQTGATVAATDIVVI